MLSCTGKKITVPCTGSKDTYGPVHGKEGRCRSWSKGFSLSREYKIKNAHGSKYDHGPMHGKDYRGPLPGKG